MEGLFEIFGKAGKQLYLVGGAVRDLVRGIAVAELEDLDFATDARPEETAAILRKSGLPAIGVGRAFGTIGTLLRDAGRVRPVQITTFRAEVYANGSRRPRVTYGESLEADLGRRDFSINAMAMDVRHRLIDPYGGQADLEMRFLRVVGDPPVIFREDPLRMLRAARFIATLGMVPDPTIIEATRAMAAEILVMAPERWLQEMNRLLVGPAVEDGLIFLADSGLLHHLLPEAQAMVDFVPEMGRYHHKALWPHTLQVVMQAPARVAVRWAALLHDAGKVYTRTVDAGGEVHFFGHEEVGADLALAVARRFRFDLALTRRLRALVAMHQRPTSYTPSWTDGAVRRFAREAGEILEDLLDLNRADITSHHPARRGAILARHAELRHRIAACAAAEAARVPLLPAGIGRAIMQHFGLPPGPAIGRMKARLEEAILDGRLGRNRPPDEYLAYLDGAPAP